MHQLETEQNPEVRAQIVANLQKAAAARLKSVAEKLKLKRGGKAKGKHG